MKDNKTNRKAGSELCAALDKPRPSTCVCPSSQQGKCAEKSTLRPFTVPGRPSEKQVRATITELRPVTKKSVKPKTPSVPDLKKEDRLDMKEFRYENMYCPHVLVSKWQEERRRVCGTPCELSSHDDQYCYYKRVPNPQFSVFEFSRCQNKSGTGKDNLTYPFKYKQYRTDGLTSYQTQYNTYKCCSKPSMQPLHDFEKGLIYTQKDRFEKGLKKYHIERKKLLARDPCNEGNVDLTYLIPKIQTYCPPGQLEECQIPRTRKIIMSSGDCAAYLEHLPVEEYICPPDYENL